MKRFDLQGFNLQLNDEEIKEQYQVKINNRYAALENCDKNVDINRAWKSIRRTIKSSAKESLGHYELKQHKSWFNKEHSKLLDKTKQAKLQ
jgi:lipoate-protein ligase A